MAVHARLACALPRVDANMTPGGVRLRLQQVPAPELKQALDGVPFRLIQVEVVHDVPAGNREELAFARRDGRSWDQKGQLVRIERGAVRSSAEQATRVAVCVRLCDDAEVGVVSRALVGVAEPTERLKVVEGRMWSTSSARSSAEMPHNSQRNFARFNVS